MMRYIGTDDNGNHCVRNMTTGDIETFEDETLANDYIRYMSTPVRARHYSRCEDAPCCGCCE